MKKTEAIEMLTGCHGDFFANAGDVLDVPEGCPRKMANALIARGMAKAVKRKAEPKPEPKKGKKD